MAATNRSGSRDTQPVFARASQCISHSKRPVRQRLPIFTQSLAPSKWARCEGPNSAACVVSSMNVTWITPMRGQGLWRLPLSGSSRHPLLGEDPLRQLADAMHGAWPPRDYGDSRLADIGRLRTSLTCRRCLGVKGSRVQISWDTRFPELSRWASSASRNAVGECESPSMREAVFGQAGNEAGRHAASQAYAKRHRVHRLQRATRLRNCGFGTKVSGS
jgi:hypothetical protein